MSNPNSIREIDLTPIPGKRYWNCDREWREEFVYFLLVDRFHDDLNRTPVNTPNRSAGSGTPSQLQKFCGGTLKGVKNHLDYIQNLGCTAIWLSPIFENNDSPNRNSHNYHGYSIQNYLNIDPRFGTKSDLIDLVNAAHDRGIRVFLDVVVNHSGNNWSYPGDYDYYYCNDQQFNLSSWRLPDRPIPQELRNPDYYHRRGQIRNWDTYPEYQRGDFLALKDFNNDEDKAGRELQEILIESHCYWIREADIDGFRMDAVKHMGELTVSRFCSAVREYAYSLGKKWFFLFGELIAGDEAVDRYIGANTPTQVGDRTVYFGLSSVLDFPLYWTLPNVLKGLSSPMNLIERYESLRNSALNRGELGRYRVTFLDNHDQIGASPKRRFAAHAPEQQVIAGIGYLLCALGTACIYYGTEQGFSGEGSGDESIREAMFDLNNQQTNYLNQQCNIYQEIAKIANIYRHTEPLRFGRMYFREISTDGDKFGLPQVHPCTLAFSRILGYEEILVAYNTSTTQRRTDFVMVDSNLQHKNGQMKFLYGKGGTVPILSHPEPNNPSLFVKLELEPMELVILRGV
ncbi:MAG TPA: alpha-amylase family glycosyl hydrolase [Allocoleopsis sp.]